ncbi:DUF4392 domain-containing protein [Fischerella sp. PCC 9605]|uniref:DUF4392 domain-containing protein n=1 Tax=Fischerella sp. PCC 9605 TaxID=1173024 RepID=UPI001E336B2C|nr:DUF4392 domain-containing protein [Fischerella sp. PCC 9605]
MTVLMKNALKYSPEILDKIAQLESICGRDVGRGIQPLVQIAKGGLLATACSIAEHPEPHVAIITGFFLPYANPPAPETDGPIGCALLAAGLLRAGVPVRIVTDSLCFRAVKIALLAAGVPASIPFDIVPVETTTGNHQVVSSLLNFWDSLERPISHVISIERPGPSYDGIVRNMRGQDITAYTAPLHILFASEKIISVGIGDGGNELGMGNIPKEVIHQHIRHGEKIACIITCNHLIVCGVSNWGATGLLTALSLLRPDWKSAIISGLNPKIEFRILETIVKYGPAVDGVKAVQSLSVDNLAWEFHAQVLQVTTRLMW